jgi:hypothetical protein
LEKGVELRLVVDVVGHGWLLGFREGNEAEVGDWSGVQKGNEAEEVGEPDMVSVSDEKLRVTELSVRICGKRVRKGAGDVGCIMLGKELPMDLAGGRRSVLPPTFGNCMAEGIRTHASITAYIAGFLYQTSELQNCQPPQKIVSINPRTPSSMHLCK